MPVRLEYELISVQVIGLTTAIQDIAFVLYPFQQVAGLVPVESCDFAECRKWPDPCEYKNVVFGQIDQSVPLTYKIGWVIPQPILDYINDGAVYGFQSMVTDDLTINQVWTTNPPFDLFPVGHLYQLVNEMSRLYPQYQWSTDGGSLFMVSNTPITAGNMNWNVYLIGTFSTVPNYFRVPYTLMATYENDFQSFFFNNPLYSQNNDTTLLFVLQRWSGTAWVDKYTFGNDMGQYFPNGSISGLPNYAGIIINWGAVLASFSVGCYRLMVTSTLHGVVNCRVSLPFNLLRWNCNQAAGTCKFETQLTGKIGDKRIDYLVYNLGAFTMYDSIRLHGFFGYEVISKYLETNLEYGPPLLGKIVKIRDEAISEFTFKIKQDTPKWVHERFAVYGLMANEIRVSDYNLNNSDHDIKQMLVVKSGNYEPEYFDAKGKRSAGVQMKFIRGVSSTIKTNCS